jgi:hypothetical protein
MEDTSTPLDPTEKLSRTWLPVQGARRFINVELLYVLVGALLSILITLVYEGTKNSSDKPTVNMAIVLQFCVTTIFGMLVTHWLNHSQQADSHRQFALRQEELVDNAFLEFSRTWSQTTNALRTLPQKPTDEAVKVAQYFLGSQCNELRDAVQRAATEIGRLGFDEQDFLQVKTRRFEHLESSAIEALSKIARAPDATMPDLSQHPHFDVSSMATDAKLPATRLVGQKLLKEGD